MLKLASSLGLLALCTTTAAQTTWFVDDDNCPGGTGTAADPFCRIQNAIDASQSGDTILVHPGSYPCTRFKGKNVHVRSLEGIDATTIAGVQFVDGEGPGAVLEGFKVAGSGCFGEIRLVVCAGADPTIVGNQIGPSFNGGGMELRTGSDPRILHNRFWNNQSIPGRGGIGAAILATASSPRIQGNVFSQNRAWEDMGGSYGGALYMAGSNALIVSNLFEGNSSADTAANRGGAIYAGNSTLTIIGNTFVNNSAFDANVPGRGGAIYGAGSILNLTNNILWGDNASEGTEVYLTSGVLNINHSTVEAGLAGVGGAGSVNWGAGMQAVDPALDATFHLTAGSPMIEAGTPVFESGGADGDRDPRLLDGDQNGVARVDIGWDEWNPTQLIVVGNGALGAPLDFATIGTAGQFYLLGGSTAASELPAGPLGSLFLSLVGFQLFGSGAVPGNDSVAIPTSTSLVGTRAYFQSLALTTWPSLGSFSRRVDVTLH